MGKMIRHNKSIFIILIGILVGILLCVGTLPLALKYGYGFLFGLLGGALFSISVGIALLITDA